MSWHPAGLRADQIGAAAAVGTQTTMEHVFMVARLAAAAGLAVGDTESSRYWSPGLPLAEKWSDDTYFQRTLEVNGLRVNVGLVWHNVNLYGVDAAMEMLRAETRRPAAGAV